MKSLRRRRTKPDGKSSHDLWPGELKKQVKPCKDVHMLVENSADYTVQYKSMLS